MKNISKKDDTFFGRLRISDYFCKRISYFFVRLPKDIVGKNKAFAIISRSAKKPRKLFLDITTCRNNM